MNTKILEVRDRATFIPVMATETLAANEGQEYLLKRSGYGNGFGYVIVTRLVDVRAEYDAYKWPQNPRTMHVAHRYIEANFERLKDGDVVDVEFILGETEIPKTSESMATI